MANAEHVALLKQGVEVWNQWRENYSEIKPDLTGVNLKEVDLRAINLSYASLSGADLTGTNLSNANLSDANFASSLHKELKSASLTRANLTEASLTRANLSGVDLTRAVLIDTLLFQTQLTFAKLIGADLNRAKLIGADLIGASLDNAKLTGANLTGASLDNAKLIGADLSKADLMRTQVMRTSFEGAVFTGACLQDWNISSGTSFDGAICDYVYLKADQQERRPRDGTFNPGEFAALFQQAIDTVDLIFKDGIDWQAFFQSFQDLRSQYADQDLSIQAIEKKHGGAFVVRVEVAENADKTSIESSAKELYETKLTLLEQRYRAELKAKDGEIFAYREQSANLMKITELLGSKIMPSEINQTFNAPVGNAAGTNHGNMSAIQNNYGPNTEDITRLLTALRDQAQAFPTEQKDDANDVLDDLERDLADEQPDQARIGRRLKKLVALGAAIGTIASGAAAVSGDVSTFTGNVIELTEQLGISVEQVQLPASGTP